MEISMETDRHKDEEQDRRGKDSHYSWGKKEVMLFRDLKRLVIEAAQVWLRNTSSTRDASVFICGADETETWTPATTVMIGELIRVEELLVRTKSPSSERIKAEILLPGIKTQTIYTHTQQGTNESERITYWDHLYCFIFFDPFLYDLLVSLLTLLKALRRLVLAYVCRKTERNHYQDPCHSEEQCVYIRGMLLRMMNWQGT